MRKYLLALCLFSSLSSQLYANNQIDSLYKLLHTDKEDTNKVNHLNKLCWEYRLTGNYDTAIYYGNASLQLAKQLYFQKGIATAYNNIGIIYGGF